MRAPSLGSPLQMWQQSLSRRESKQLVEWCAEKERCFCCKWFIYWARDTKSSMSEVTCAAEDICLGEARIPQINTFDQKRAMNPIFLQQLFYIDLSPSLSFLCAVTAGRSMPSGTGNLGHCGPHRFSRDSGCQPPALHRSVHHAGHGSNALPAGLPRLLWCHPWEQMPPALCKCPCNFCWPPGASQESGWLDRWCDKCRNGCLLL